MCVCMCVYVCVCVCVCVVAGMIVNTWTVLKGISLDIFIRNESTQLGSLSSAPPPPAIPPPHPIAAPPPHFEILSGVNLNGCLEPFRSFNRIGNTLQHHECPNPLSPPPPSLSP